MTTALVKEMDTKLQTFISLYAKIQSNETPDRVAIEKILCVEEDLIRILRNLVDHPEMTHVERMQFRQKLDTTERLYVEMLRLFNQLSDSKGSTKTTDQ